MRFADMKIWIKLTAVIWVMLVIAWTGMIFWESKVNRDTAIAQATQFSPSMPAAKPSNTSPASTNARTGSRRSPTPVLVKYSSRKDKRRHAPPFVLST
jgi:methyl-accepting chemotaxis protein